MEVKTAFQMPKRMTVIRRKCLLDNKLNAAHFGSPNHAEGPPAYLLSGLAQKHGSVPTLNFQF
jgi:hypothetical protein